MSKALDANDIHRRYGLDCLRDVLDVATPFRRPAEPTPVERLAGFGEGPGEATMQAEINQTIAPMVNHPQRPAPPKFKCVAIDDVEIGNEPAYCVDRILPARGLACIVGSPKAGKSFFAADMLFHVARGAPYAGRDTLQGPVVYLTGEGINGFRRRLIAMRRHYRVEGRGVQFFHIEKVPDLGSATTDLPALLADLDCFIAERRISKPRVIVLDTLARCMGEGDENSSRDMGRFVNRCTIIEEHYKCLVAVVHHFGKDKERRGRGSNSLNGAADVTIEVEKFEASRRVRVAEMKDGAEGQEWRFRLMPFNVGEPTDGEVHPCCATSENWTKVVELLSAPSDPQPRATKPPRPVTGVAGDLLKIIQRAVDEAGDLNLASTKAPKGARAISREMLKKDCVSWGWQQDKEPNSFRAVLSSNLSTLRAKDLIDFDANAIWLTQP